MEFFINKEDRDASVWLSATTEHRCTAVRDKTYEGVRYVHAGIDIGSAATKGVILKDGSQIVDMRMVDMGTGTSGTKRVLDTILEESGLSMDDISFTVATAMGVCALSRRTSRSVS